MPTTYLTYLVIHLREFGAALATASLKPSVNTLGWTVTVTVTFPNSAPATFRFNTIGDNPMVDAGMAFSYLMDSVTEAGTQSNTEEKDH